MLTGLIVNQRVKFFLYKLLFTACLCILRLFKLERPNNISGKPCCQVTQIKIFTYPGLNKSGFEQPGPGALLLSFTKSIYYILILDNKQAVLAELQSSSDLIKDALTELDEVSTPQSSFIKPSVK